MLLAGVKTALVQREIAAEMAAAGPWSTSGSVRVLRQAVAMNAAARLVWGLPSKLAFINTLESTKRSTAGLLEAAAREGLVQHGQESL